jgi:CHAT domain-containing protein
MIRSNATCREVRSRSRSLLRLALAVCWASAAVAAPGAGAARSNDAALRAAELLRNAEKFYQNSDTRSACRIFAKAVELARQSGDRRLISDCLVGLARAYLERHELEGALAAAREALSIARIAGDHEQEAQALVQLGNVYYDLDNPHRALDYFLASLAMAREAGDRTGEATALKDVGITYRRLGRYEESLQACNNALEIYRGIGETYSALAVLENIGTCYAKLGAYDLAMRAYGSSLEIARANGFTTATIDVLTWTGYLYSEIGEHSRALVCYREAVSLAERLNRHRNQGWALMGMSAALNALGQRDEAIAATRRSLGINYQFGTWKGIADNIRDLGNLHLDSNPVVAADYYRKALAIYDRYQKELVWAPHYGLAQAHRRAGDLEQAVRHYEIAIDRIEATRSKLSLDHYRATFSAAHQRIYHNLIEALLDQHQTNANAGYDVRAFEVLEKTRARAMVEVIAEAGLDSRHEPSPELAERKQQVESRIGGLQTSLVLAQSSDSRRNIIEELNQVERELDALMVDINHRDPVPPSLPGAHSLSLDELQRSLDSQTALVAYLLTDNQAFAFVVTASSFNVERLETSPRTLAARVENYVELLETNTDGWQDVGRRLYMDLVPQFRSHLKSGVNRLIIVPDGSLHYLPFETLPRESEPQLQGSTREKEKQRPHYLLEDFTVSYCPSATMLNRLSSNGPPTSSNMADLVLFADPAIASAMTEGRSSTEAARWTRTLYEQEGLRVSSIPFSNAEAESVMRRAGPGSRLFTGEEASEKRAKTEQLDRFRVIHFATHGLISQQAPLRSALVLSAGQAGEEDGFLQAREVCQLKLSCDLVVLSACRTARGRVLAGEGVEGLASAFFYAGARSVVASLWDVTDAGTATFMTSFYDHLSTGRSKSEALREAKLDLLRNPGTAAPRDWAPFVLIGEGVGTVPIGPGTEQDKGRIWLWLGVLGIAAALASYWNKQRFGVGGRRRGR